jgi:hypothetical protein
VDLEALVGTLGGRNDRCIADERVVNARVRDQVSLELVQIHIQGTIETERGGDRANNLGNQAVQVLIGGSGDVQISAADIVHSLVVYQESTVGVFNGAVCRQNCIVWLNDSSGDTWGGVDGELKLRLLAILGGKTFKKESTKARSSTTTKGVENQETLDGLAVICGVSLASYGEP